MTFCVSLPTCATVLYYFLPSLKSGYKKLLKYLSNPASICLLEVKNGNTFLKTSLIDSLHTFIGSLYFSTRL